MDAKHTPGPWTWDGDYYHFRESSYLSAEAIAMVQDAIARATVD